MAQVAKEIEMTSSFFKNIYNPKCFVFLLFCSRFRFLRHKSRRYDNTRYLRIFTAIFAERTAERSLVTSKHGVLMLVLMLMPTFVFTWHKLFMFALLLASLVKTTSLFCMLNSTVFIIHMCLLLSYFKTNFHIYPTKYEPDSKDRMPGLYITIESLSWQTSDLHIRGNCRIVPSAWAHIIQLYYNTTVQLLNNPEGTSSLVNHSESFLWCTMKIIANRYLLNKVDTCSVCSQN